LYAGFHSELKTCSCGEKFYNVGIGTTCGHTLSSRMSEKKSVARLLSTLSVKEFYEWVEVRAYYLWVEDGSPLWNSEYYWSQALEEYMGVLFP
jgi:hypothetical protein